MKTIDLGGWRFFVVDSSELNSEKAGKWMYFFKGEEGKKFAEERCREAVSTGITSQAKRADTTQDGVACFYANSDDLQAHKKIIDYFIKHGMIRKTKNGKLYDISFKLDAQTSSGEYRNDYAGTIKLSKLMDLYTAKWLV